MRRLYGLIAVILALTFSWHAAAVIRPSFDPQEAAWDADQIVVVRVAKTCKVLETWHGFLKPGDELDVPCLRGDTKAAYDALVKPRVQSAQGDLAGAWAGACLYVSAKYDATGQQTSASELHLLEGARAILFLRNEDNTAGYFFLNPRNGSTAALATLLPERSVTFSRYGVRDEPLPLSVAWVFRGHVHVLRQLDSSMAPEPWPLGYIPGRNGTPAWTEAQLKDQVMKVVAVRKELDALQATKDPAARVRALRHLDTKGVEPAAYAVQRVLADYIVDLVQRANAMPDGEAGEAMVMDFVQSDLFMPTPMVVQSLGQGGACAVSAIIHVLDEPEWEAMNCYALRALFLASGPDGAGEFIKRLDAETAFWRQYGGDLPNAWLDVAARDRSDRFLSVQRHHNFALTLLGILENTPHPERQRAVRVFSEVWGAQSHPYESVNRPDAVANACRGLLQATETQPGSTSASP